MHIRLRSGLETAQRLGDTLRQVVDHATYHRGQEAMLTRQLDGSPVSTDSFAYDLLRDAGQLPSSRRFATSPQLCSRTGCGLVAGAPST